jgi:hypothetical protein
VAPASVQQRVLRLQNAYMAARLDGCHAAALALVAGKSEKTDAATARAIQGRYACPLPVAYARLWLLASCLCAPSGLHVPIAYARLV